MTDILVICNDVVGTKMAGPAIRCVEIAKILARRAKVILSSPKISVENSFPIEIICSDVDQFEAVALSMDIIIFQGDALNRFPFLKKFRGVLISDLYCPISLEYHQVSDGLSIDVRSATIKYLSDSLFEQLVYADHFLCASEKQKEFWLGALTLAGRINAHRWPVASHADLSDLISILPFGLDSTVPVLERKALRSRFKIPESDFVMVWGGGVYQWFDPLTIIKALRRLIDEGAHAHLVFIGVKHPNPGISQHDMCAKAVALADELGILDKFVHFNFGWVDYSDRHNYLLDADIGVSAHFDNPETRYAFRTRMLDYLWCGLPIVATKGDVFGDSLDTEGAGVSVDFEDVEGWVSALKRLMNDPHFLRACREGSFTYAQKFRWDRVTELLVEKCKSLVPSPDRDFIRSEFQRKSIKPSISVRLRHVYAMGGMRSLAGVLLRRIGRFIY